MAIDPFWREFAAEVGLDQMGVPKPMAWPGRRPDLTVILGDKAVAVIEAENWSVNQPQIDDYLKHCGLPVYSILGTAEPQAGTTWSRISEMALGVRAEVSSRQVVILDLLLAAVSDILSLSPHSATRWLKRPDELPKIPWLLEACAPLLALPDDVVGAHAVTKGSASVRLRKPRWAVNAGRSGLGLAYGPGGQAGHGFPTGDPVRPPYACYRPAGRVSAA
jgi:hypothetical protein